MKVGDMIIRKISKHDQYGAPSRAQIRRLGHGIILSKQMAGSNPVHPCITVYYPKTGQIYDIAESLVELVNECR